MASTALCRAIWIPSTLALGGALVAFASNPVSIPPPASDLAPYEASDKSITVSHPSNWLPRQTAANANQTAVSFLPARGVFFEVKGDLQGSLMGDIAKSTGGGMPMGGVEIPSDVGSGGGSVDVGDMARVLNNASDRKSPVETLHEAEMDGLKSDLKNFSEGETKKIQLSGMEAVTSDFTFQLKNVFFNTDAMGRQVTALNGERRYRIYYYFPKSAQSMVEPVFEKMLQSIKIGTVGG